MRRALVFVLSLVTACGGDDENAPPPPTPAGGTPAAGAPAGAGSGSGAPLVPMMHIEDRVVCGVPTRVQDIPDPKDRCDVTAMNPCKDRTKAYCLTVPVANNIAYCMACNERDNIRHPFKDRDFVGDPSQNRDPFQSFILVPVGTGSADKPVIDATTQPQCTKYNTFAGSVSYQDLKLEGLVTEGTQRKALMAAGSHNSYIIKRNDCVGREKALIKEVGDGYVTFVTLPDPTVANAKPAEYSVQLHTSIALNSIESPPSDEGPSSQTNVPPPTKIQGPAPTPTPTPKAKSNVKLVPIPGPQPPAPVIPPPATAPPQLKP